MAEVIQGDKIAREMQQDVKKRFDVLRASSKKDPKLVSIVVGGDGDTRLYVRAQKKAADSIGILFDTCELEKDVSREDLTGRIEDLNRDEAVTAIMLQHPLPERLDYSEIVQAITPGKDAEGIHPYNLGRIFRSEAEIVPCTPGAVMKILRVQGVNLYGKDVVIIGHSAIVGKPLSLMMLNETATTTVCHIGTAEKGDIVKYVKNAEVLIVAVGKAEMVKGDWIREGAVVIDVGINSKDGKIVGDVDHKEAAKKASMITPVPGGVGPVTVSVLMRNVLRIYGGSREKV